MMNSLQECPGKSRRSTATSRTRVGLFAGLLAVVMLTTHGARADADADAVLEVVNRLFSAMRDKDEAGLRQQFLPEARLGTAPVDPWIAQVVAGSAELDEQTYDETVLIDGDLAMAWTPYTLYVDGAFHHCGADVFVLRRVDASWRILQIDDTRRTAGCDQSR